MLSVVCVYVCVCVCVCPLADAVGGHGRALFIGSIAFATRSSHSFRTLGEELIGSVDAPVCSTSVCATSSTMFVSRRTMCAK